MGDNNNDDENDDDIDDDDGGGKISRFSPPGQSLPSIYRYVHFYITRTTS